MAYVHLQSKCLDNTEAYSGVPAIVTPEQLKQAMIQNAA